MGLPPAERAKRKKGNVKGIWKLKPSHLFLLRSILSRRAPKQELAAGATRCCQTALRNVLQQARQQSLLPNSEPGDPDDSLSTMALSFTTNSQPADQQQWAALCSAWPDRIRSPVNDFVSSSPRTCGVLKGERQLPSVYVTEMHLGTQQVAEPWSTLHTLPKSHPVATISASPQDAGSCWCSNNWDSTICANTLRKAHCWYWVQGRPLRFRKENAKGTYKQSCTLLIIWGINWYWDINSAFKPNSLLSQNLDAYWCIYHPQTIHCTK